MTAARFICRFVAAFRATVFSGLALSMLLLFRFHRFLECGGMRYLFRLIIELGCAAAFLLWPLSFSCPRPPFKPMGFQRVQCSVGNHCLVFVSHVSIMLQTCLLRQNLIKGTTCRVPLLFKGCAAVLCAICWHFCSAQIGSHLRFSGHCNVIVAAKNSPRT